MSKKTTNLISEIRQYQPTPEEQAIIEKARRAQNTSPVPRIKIGKKGAITTDHPEEALGLRLLEIAIGSLDRSFTAGLLSQLAQAVRRQGKVDELDLNFMISFIKSIEPRDQMESALAAQMTAAHIQMMRFAERMGRFEGTPHQDSAVRCFTQLARTFAVLMEALRRYRTGGEQKIIIQRVSVSEGGQAIVGNVTQAPRELEGRQSTSPTLPSLSRKAEIGPVEQPSASLKRRSR
jgi:hypothetical protein